MYTACHPGLRVHWFKKNWDHDDYIVALRVISTRHAEYLALCPEHAPKMAPQKAASSSHSLMNELIGSDDSDFGEQQPVEVPEWERYTKAAYTSQQKDHPLLWWKVCQYVSVLDISHDICRQMPWSFQHMQRWPRTTWPCQQPPLLLSVYSPVPSIFALQHVLH
jgi:hypothetical protein